MVSPTGFDEIFLHLLFFYCYRYAVKDGICSNFTRYEGKQFDESLCGCEHPLGDNCLSASTAILCPRAARIYMAGEAITTVVIWRLMAQEMVASTWIRFNNRNQ